MSPKKYWENGALLNGVFCRRAGCSDEMLVTALTVRAATSVKSGPEVRMRPASVVAGGAAGAAAPAGVGSFAGGAGARSAGHIRPVRTRPITKPALTSSRMSNRRRMSLADVDAPRTGAGRFGNGHREDTVAQIGGDAIDVNVGGEREAAEEGAVAALNAMETLARHVGLGPRPLQDQLAVVKPNLDVVSLQPWQLRGDDVSVRGLVEIDRRRPPRALVAREPLHALLEREEIAQRIPACKGHEGDRSTYRPEV